MKMLTDAQSQILIHPDVFQPGDYTEFKQGRRRSRWLERFHVPLAIRSMHLPQNRRVLEIGCGYGFALTPIFYLCRPTRLVGIDINRRFLKRASRRLKVREVEAELYCEDVRRLPFPDMSFDIVFDFGTCYHIAHNDEALREIARILTVSGIFVCETPVTQRLCHPVRSFGKHIPWKSVPELKPRHSAFFWTSREKLSNGYLR